MYSMLVPCHWLLLTSPACHRHKGFKVIIYIDLHPRPRFTDVQFEHFKCDYMFWNLYQPHNKMFNSIIRMWHGKETHTDKSKMVGQGFGKFLTKKHFSSTLTYISV